MTDLPFSNEVWEEVAALEHYAEQDPDGWADHMADVDAQNADRDDEI